MSVFRYDRMFLIAAAVVALATTGCGEGALLGPVANASSASDYRKALESGKPAGGTDAAAATGTGWATLTGRFIYADPAAAPKMPPYNVDKEPHICTVGGKPPLTETLEVSSTGGIKNVVIYLRNASRVNDTAQPSKEVVPFDQKTCQFLTHVMAVTIGQPILLKNSDPTGHNANIQGTNNKFNRVIEDNKSMEYVMQKEEVKPAAVSCTIHPWMQAYLMPRQNGYVAVTDAEGNFKIANVPAGEDLEFVVWHEKATGSDNYLALATPEAKALKWTNKGRFKIKLNPDETKDLAITVPPSAFN